MDEHTLSVLDFPRVREVLAGLALTELGRQAVERLRPGLDRPAIEREFELTEELLKIGEEPPLGQVSDIGLLLGDERRQEGILSPVELLAVRAALEGMGRVHDYLVKQKAKLPLVAQECSAIRSFEPLVKQIDKVVAPTAEVKDDASPELNRVRIRLRRMRREIMRSMDTIVQSNPDLFQDQSISIRAGRFVLPLRADAKGRFDAVLHDTSDSGHTLFVEPLSMLPEQNEFARLRSAEQEEVQRVLRQVTSAIQAEADRLTAALAGVSRLDLLIAKKRFATRFDAVRPRVSERNSVQLINARHPLLFGQGTRSRTEAVRVMSPGQDATSGDNPKSDRSDMSDRSDIRTGHVSREVIPLNFVLPDETSVVVISGPNAGGKTVAMKTLGLFALLLSAGLFLPAAEGTELPLFEKVMADIGDEQSLEGDLSSFSAHLLRTRQILEQADKSSLILLDEIGGSTSPEEGSALAIAVLERLKDNGATTLATSHLGPLKAFVQDTRGMANAAMEYKGKPTYRLIMGVPGESSALDISRSLGFPNDVLERAHSFLNQDWLKVSERLQELTAEKEKVSRLRLELEQEHKLTLARRHEWEAKSSGLKDFERTERHRIQSEREAMLKQTRRDIENLVRRIRDEQASHEAIKEAKNYVEEKLEAQETQNGSKKAEAENPGTAPRSGDTIPGQGTRSRTEAVRVMSPSGHVPSIGDYVHSRTFARQGTVVDIERDEATVTFGNIKMKLKLKDLQVLSKAEPEPVPKSPAEFEEFDPRLTIRGMTQEEAREALVRFLDRAELTDAHEVSVLHGKGTGVLRTMLWDALRKDKRVAQIRLGEPNEGGNGVTFVTLK
jgi:DNA mismatch repair protein MutS2